MSAGGMTPEQLQQIEAVFLHAERQVWIVTAAHGNRRGGLVATWVSAASIDPQHPTVLAAIAPNHFTAELIDGSGSFGLHLITAEQIDLAWNFGIGSGRNRDKLAGLAVRKGTSGSPLLERCLAWLDCRVFARLAAGDRIYYWADVLDGRLCGDDPPLTDRQLLAAASDSQLQQLLANRQADIQRQRPLHERWRAGLPADLRPPE